MKIKKCYYCDNHRFCKPLVKLLGKHYKDPYIWCCKKCYKMLTTPCEGDTEDSLLEL